MTRPLTRSRRVEDSWVVQENAGEAETKKPLEILDHDDASSPKTEEPLESLEYDDASGPETEEPLEDTSVQHDASDLEVAEPLESLAQGAALQASPRRLTRQKKSLIRNKRPERDIETEESSAHVDASDVETAGTLESLVQEEAPQLSTQKSLRQRAPVMRNKRLDLDDGVDETLESPVQEPAPKPSTRRSTHEKTPVAHHKNAEPDLAMSSPYGSITEATSVGVDAQLRELRPVRKVDTARRRRIVRLASGAESTTESPPPGKRGAAKGQSTTRSAYDVRIQHVQDFLGETLRLTYEVTRTAVWIISPLVKVSAAVVLAIGFIGMIFWVISQILFPFARSVITALITSAYSPICHLPGIAVLPLSFCRQAKTIAPMATHLANPIGFDQVMTVQHRLEDLIASSAVNVSLSVDMTRSHASLRDLSTNIEFSSLRSRDKLLLEFDGFVKTARIASNKLLRYNSHIDRTCDITISITTLTKLYLEDLAIKEASKGALQLVTDKVSAQLGFPKYTEKALRRRYIKHTSAVEAEIHGMMEEAKELLAILNNLDDRLGDIHAIVVQESDQVTASKEEVLSQLWKILGGNRMERKDLERRLRLLKMVELYKRSAYAHVRGTLDKLEEIKNGLHDLQKRIEAHESSSHFSEAPLSVHIQHVESGLKKLKDARSYTKTFKEKRWKEALEQLRNPLK